MREVVDEATANGGLEVDASGSRMAGCGKWAVVIFFGLLLVGSVGSLIDPTTPAKPGATPPAASSRPSETAAPPAARSSPEKTYTPEQTAAARSLMENLKYRATVEDSGGSTLYVTFNDGIERDRIYKAAEIIVIADQVLGRTRYVHFYDPTRREIATFSPLTGLKVLDK